MSETEALNTDINVIYLAEKARWEELKVCHGLKPEKEKVGDISKEEALRELQERNKK